MAKTRFITMSHPELKGTAQVTQKAFDDVWSAKGWEVIADEEATARAEVESFDIEGATKPQLVAEAERRGLDTSGKVDELRDRLRASNEEG